MDALDKRTFEMWVREITTRLDRQDKLIAMLARKEYEKDHSDVMEIPLVDGERLLDNQDLCMLLQFSKRSLQRYRSMKRKATTRCRTCGSSSGNTERFSEKETRRFTKPASIN